MPQSRKWQLTFNNPEEHGFTHDAIVETTLGTVAFNVTAKLNGRTNSFVVYNSARLDVNGSEAVAYVHNGSTVTVTSKNASASMIAGTVKASATVTTGTDKKGTYTFASSDADTYGVIALNAAAAVTYTGVTVKAGSDNVATTNLVAIGTKLTVTDGSNKTTGKAIEATVNGTATAGKTTDNSVATMDYTMTKDAVAFALITPDTKVDVTVEATAPATYSKPVYTANNGTDKFDVAVVGTAMTNGTVKVEVTPKTGVSEEVALTLTPANASVSPSTITWSDGQSDKRKFTVTLSTNATVTLALSDATKARFDVTVSGNDSSNKLTVGGVEVGAYVQAGDTVTVVAEASNYCKVISDGTTTYYENGDTFELTDDAVVTFAAKATVTLDGTAMTKNDVTGTPTAIAGTAYKPGETVTATVTMSGTEDGTGDVTFSFNETGTYADSSLTGTSGTDYDLSTSSGLTVKSTKTVTGDFTFEFVIGETNVTLTLTAN